MSAAGYEDFGELEAAGFLVRRASQHRAPRYALTIPAGVFAAFYQPADRR